jgi:peptidylprolyl isomerase
MKKAAVGDIVKTHYKGSLSDGTLFDESTESEPFKFTIGRNQVIPGFEQAVVGMGPGDSKTVTIAAEEAYGPRDNDLVLDVPRDQFPSDLDAKVGDEIEMTEPDGQTTLLVVVDINNETVKLDANHPLAGQDLTFHIELVDFA